MEFPIFGHTMLHSPPLPGIRRSAGPVGHAAGEARSAAGR
jgi:hypothetical protein